VKIGVTGGAGFLGRYVVDLLQSINCEIVIISRRSEISTFNGERIRLVKCDIRSNQVKTVVKDLDILIHCAGSVGSKDDMFSLNVEGTKNLLEKAENIGKFIFLSSAGIYRKVQGLIVEDSDFAPGNFYEETKLLADLFVEEFSRRHNLPTITLRPTAVFGEDMTNNALRSLFRLFSHGIFPQVGSGRAWLNYVHVKDVASAVVKSLSYDRCGYEDFIISNDERYQELVSFAKSATQSSAPIITIPKVLCKLMSIPSAVFDNYPVTRSRIEVLTNNSRYDNSKAVANIGWEPSFDLKGFFHDFAVK